MTATPTAFRPIRQLPVELANQIAAGEVIERPASVVKELVENSLDAGATRIEVSLRRGGLQAIMVRDNGWGIPKDQLPLAISRHATSKISSLDELENIRSLGFRGEALASIGSVSRMQLLSCCADCSEAWQIDCARDDLKVRDASHPVGTSIIVQDLFYNTPARRKFMRTEKTEFRHSDEVMRRMALSNFNVGFSFKHNDRLVYQFAPAETDAARSRRVARLCGKTFMEHAVLVDFTVHGLRLWGWITGPAFSRSQNDLQHFYVNGRIIRDRLITHAIRQVYQEWIPPGRHAAYLLHMEIDPAAVDVNVHPTKHEVRFRDARMVHDFIHRSLRESLPGAGQSQTHAQHGGMNSFAHYQHAAFSPPALAEPAMATDGPLGQARGLLHGRFIMAENKQGMVLVDAGQALQQLIYRKLDQALAGERTGSRPLLIPKSIPVTTEQAGLVEQSQALLRRLGFDMNCNGPASVLLRMIPVAVAGTDLESLIVNMLIQLESLTKRVLTEESYSCLIHRIAEIAAHTRMIESSPDELNRLLREIETLNNTNLWRCFTERELQALIQTQ